MQCVWISLVVNTLFLISNNESNGSEHVVGKSCAHGDIQAGCWTRSDHDGSLPVMWNQFRGKG